LFDAIQARGGVRAAVADDAWLRALLEVEAALARACGAAGVIPAEAADAISSACLSSTVEVSAVAAGAAAGGNPVIPLVPLVREAVGPAYAAYVHYGATSQDIMDTASMLVTQRALSPLLADLRGAADAAARLAAHHRDTPMMGRTLLQQAVPITFGLKAAGWMAGLDSASARLQTIPLAAQLGGAAGTRAEYGGAGAQVAQRFSSELGLAYAPLPWATDRTRVGALAGALGVACGAVAKPARDVTLLAQDEVAEVAEGSPGGSSTMAHKRNPVAAISAIACAAQAPGLVATLLAAMVHEHERAAGAWHAEWRPLRELLVATGSAAAWLRHCLGDLRIDAGAMTARANGSVGESASIVDTALAERTP
jgi:3-carboxy-cis,cis-muconate cycloisomerase